MNGTKPTTRGSAATAFLMIDVYGTHPAERLFMHDTTVRFKGISLDVRTQVVGAKRAGLANDLEVATYGIGRRVGEGQHSTRIYAVPTNTWLNARKLTAVYEPREHKPSREYVWGPSAQPVSQDEVDAIVAFREWRRAHMDASLVDVVKKQLAALPKAQRRAESVYVASAYSLLRRRLGVFTSYERALHMTPADATIIEVPADGQTPSHKGRMVRGQFKGGWGYAGGFAPPSYATTG